MSNILVTLAINIAVLAAFFFFFKRRIDRSLSATEILDTVRDEVQHLIVELNQTSDRNVGLLEDKIAGLQQLLQEADRKIMTLNRELDKHNVTTRLYDHLQKSAALTKPDKGAAKLEERKNNSSEKTEADSRSVSQEVLELHRQGFAAGIIASKVGTTVGEVELIISLRNKGR